MPIDPARLSQCVEAVAALRGVLDSRRVDAVRGRLAFAVDDLDALDRATASHPAWAEPVPVAFDVPTAAPSPSTHAAGGDGRGVAGLAAAVGRGARRAATEAESMLDAAARWRHLNGWTWFDPEAVRRDAQTLDAAVARGDAVGPLAGVPFAVKDLMDVAGAPISGGTKARAPRVARTDAVAVARLRAAGAVVAGLANLHECAFGTSSANPHFGAVVNPRHPDRLPGGSSGGSGALVAAGVVPIAIGSDTGGSIRIPAACCGIVGFKPTRGVVPLDGVLPLAASLDHLGPMAADVADCARMFEVMAGLASGSVEACAAQAPLPRLGVLGGWFATQVEAGVAAGVGAALDTLAARGFASHPVDGAFDAAAAGAQLVMLTVEAADANAALLAPGAADRLGEDVRLRFEMGQCLFATDYVKARRVQAATRRAMLANFADADVLVAPTLPCAPPRVGQAMLEIGGVTRPVAAQMVRFTGAFNLTGLPALSLPCGFDADGLPVSLQLVGRPGADVAVLAAGLRVAAALGLDAA
jgi:aspartyl-tRNA(Asn)/glutamyl-tRNA(Gln) amidotransferase subunit A